MRPFNDKPLHLELGKQGTQQTIIALARRRNDPRQGHHATHIGLKSCKIRTRDQTGKTDGFAPGLLEG